MELYDPLDIYIGNWLTDIPYEFTGETYEEASRTYETREKIKQKMKGCPVERFFGNKINFGVKTKFRMNGRNYYRVSNLGGTVALYSASIPRPISLCDGLSPYNGVHINLASLICTNLIQDKMTWPQIFDLLRRCDQTSECYPCSPVGHKIAASLIRVASTRIFADPEQSILELPVNSIDSYFPESRVGKFGMGFFSFLYWLVDHPKRMLQNRRKVSFPLLRR